MKYWEIISDNLSKAGWSWGCFATVDSRGRTIFVADAHRDDGKRYFVRAYKRLTVSAELERQLGNHDVAGSKLPVQFVAFASDCIRKVLTLSVGADRVVLALSPSGVFPKVPPDSLPAGLTRERKARSHNSKTFSETNQWQRLGHSLNNCYRLLSKLALAENGCSLCGIKR